MARLNGANDYSLREAWREAIDHARTYADGDESMYSYPEIDDDAFPQFTIPSGGDYRS